MNHFAMLSPLLTGSKHEYTLVEGQKQNSVQTDSKLIKGSDWQSEVVELSMQYCAQIL